MIIRWTFGPSTELGASVLRKSVKQAAKLFPEAKRYVVVNSGAEVDVDAEILQAYEEEGVPPANLTAWKYAPTRISVDDHELSMDNDIIFHKRPEVIDKWLASNNFLTYESVYFNHGVFAPLPWKINSGIMGFPPGFCLRSAIVSACETHGVIAWKSHFDDQGCWAWIVGEKLRFEIAQSEIPCLEPDQVPRRGSAGVHLVGVNRTENHLAAISELKRSKVF